MAKDKFPYTAYMLTPAYAVRKVTVAKKGWYHSQVELNTGSCVSTSALFTTKSETIAAGEKALSQRRARLATSAANIEKHAANLAKAEAANG